MLALCLMLSIPYYAQNYAGIIGLGLIETLFLNQVELSIQPGIDHMSYKHPLEL